MRNRKIRIALPERTGNADNYAEALKALGAETVFAGTDAGAQAFDGLLLPGGADLDPARYGQENTASEGIDGLRDAQEFGLLDRFVREGKPVFGICRGHQIINVYFGGTLIQDLPSAVRHSRMGGREDKVHGCEALPGSFLVPFYGERFSVNSSHHQAVDVPGRGLRIAARADDGTVEALEHETLPVWSVQWHPERMCFAHRRTDTVDGSRILRFFLNRCGH